MCGHIIQTHDIIGRIGLNLLSFSSIVDLVIGIILYIDRHSETKRGRSLALNDAQSISVDLASRMCSQTNVQIMNCQALLINCQHDSLDKDANTTCLPDGTAETNCSMNERMNERERLYAARRQPVEMT